MTAAMRSRAAQRWLRRRRRLPTDWPRTGRSIDSCARRLGGRGVATGLAAGAGAQGPRSLRRLANAGRRLAEPRPWNKAGRSAGRAERVRIVAIVRIRMGARMSLPASIGHIASPHVGPRRTSAHARHAAPTPAGRGHVALVAGEAGIGKTSVLRALADGDTAAQRQALERFTGWARSQQSKPCGADCARRPCAVWRAARGLRRASSPSV